jgi:hypothetical protein
MRARGTWLAIAFGLALGPNAAAADDVHDTLRQMQERLTAVEDQLSASNAKVAEQQKLIEQSGIGTAPVSSGGINGFLNSLEFDGWVSASYWYNFNRPSNNDLIGGNTGTFGQSNPFNPDANQFSFDQLWFVLGKPATADSPAGFHAEIAYGKTAGLLPFGNYAGGGNNLYIPSAYAEYMTPFGPTIKMGKFGTLIGAEVAQAPLNWNISRGLVYNLLQPIDHTGVLVSGEAGESGFDYAFGVVNQVFSSQPTATNGKAYTGHLGYGQDNWKLGANIIYGQYVDNFERPKNGIFDLLFSMDPTERFSFWVNADFDWATHAGHGWGIATAGRYALTDKLGAALRVEYVDDSGDYFGYGTDALYYGITGTVDYALTDHLTVKGEVRFDQGRLRKAPDDLYVSHDTLVYDNSNQTVIGAEVIYRF